LPTLYDLKPADADAAKLTAKLKRAPLSLPERRGHC